MSDDKEVLMHLTWIRARHRGMPDRRDLTWANSNDSSVFVSHWHRQRNLAVHAVGQDRAQVNGPITIEVSDSLVMRATGTVTFDDVTECKKKYVYTSKMPKIAMPPGYVMSRIACGVFFFARNIPRMFEELVADFQYDMFKAEAKGATAAAVWRLRLKYWGAFIWMLAGQLPAGIVGKIIRALTKG